jgi:CheY-like chemotaxis protein
VLSRAGFAVTLANDGEQAIKILEVDEFFAVLMDIRMPVLDGMQAIKIIRAREALIHVPVIALSTGVLDTQVTEALEAGFHHHMSKPIDFPQLFRLLAEFGGIEDSK